MKCETLNVVVARSTMKPFLAVCLLSVVALSQSPAPRQVTFKSGDETASGLLFTPANAKGKLPAIVVIQEWNGVNDWVKEQAQHFADQGYVALAVDLYRGKVAKDPDQAHELMAGLPPERATRDLVAGVAFLKAQANVDPKRIGAIGWCMGGGYSALLAVNEPSLKAAVINYGRLPASPD